MTVTVYAVLVSPALETMIVTTFAPVFQVAAYPLVCAVPFTVMETVASFAPVAGSVIIHFFKKY